MLAILDYKAGNQTSVLRALTHLGIPAEITAEPTRLSAADGVIFPGVGAAGQAMDTLTQSGLDTTLRKLVAAHKPLLGICLGCQIMLTRSEENATTTLGIVDGLCLRFDENLHETDGERIRIPHMGWNSLRLTSRGEASPLFAGICPEASMYFVHSYYVRPADPDLTLACCDYGVEFCAAYGREGLWAVQFHPEKSGRPGLQLLANFHAWCCTREESC